MIEVAKQPKDPGPAAWNAILPPAPAPKPLEGVRTADWLIIGAGWAGLAAARRLTELRPGERIAVLEARRVADGPAGRNSGFMIDLPHDLSAHGYAGELERDRAAIARNRAAIRFALEAAEDYEMPGEAIVQSGKVNAAATRAGLKHNADYAAHLDALGEPYEALDAAAMQAMTGTDYYLGGLKTPGAAIAQPALYIRGMAAGLRRVGVGIHENSPVIAMDRRDGVWRALTPEGAIDAPRVILAVNGHAQSFGFFERRLMHWFTYASMTRALTPDEVRTLGGEATWGVLPADPMGATVRRVSGIGGDRIVVRSRFTYDPSMQVEDRRVRLVGIEHDRAFKARFPMLEGALIEYRWGGRLCLSWNGVPAFGELEEGLFSACCQNGLGTVQGTLAGACAADLATGARDGMTGELLAMAPPGRLPPAPLAAIGANVMMAWKTWRAGREG